MKKLLQELNWNKIVDIFLIIAIVTLLVLDKQGWGWLTLLLFLKH